MQMKKLFKKTTDKQTIEQSVENNQLSFQMSISSKTLKKLMQFFVNEFDKISDSFKIKLEVFMFIFRSELFFNELEVNSENENKISDEIKKILKIIKK